MFIMLIVSISHQIYIYISGISIGNGYAISKEFIFLDNKRLDEWVTEDRLDLRKVQFPRKDGSKEPGSATPKRIGLGGGQIPSSAGSVTPQPVEKERQTSRPTSPVSSLTPDFISGSTVLATALQKKMSRKRKGTSLEADVSFTSVSTIFEKKKYRLTAKIKFKTGLLGWASCCS